VLTHSLLFSRKIFISSKLFYVFYIFQISPTHILQIESPKYNFSRLTRAYVQSANGWLFESAQKIPPFQLIVMNTNEIYPNE